jgi:hypothetical protein
MTLNAMHTDVLVVRHPESGAVQLPSEKVDCAVINVGDGSHEHPTKAFARRVDDPPAQGSTPRPHGRDAAASCSTGRRRRRTVWSSPVYARSDRLAIIDHR